MGYLKQKINLSLENTALFRYGFYLTLILILSLDYYHEIDLYPLHLLASILLGIGFYEKSKWFLSIIASFVVLFRSYVSSPHIVTFLLLWIVYLMVTFLGVWLTKSYRKTKEAKLELIIALSKSLDSRDAYTAHHSENVANYAFMIAKEMKLPQKECEFIYIGGLLHDIGKIGVPEPILLKTGRLSSEEYEVIKRHPVIGYETLKHITSFQENGVLEMVLFHHERFDGKGYPKGLKGEQIPLSARILAVADTFDAMTSRRVYRDKMDIADVQKELSKNRGIQFDPQIVEVFLRILLKEGGEILLNESTPQQNLGGIKFIEHFG